MFQIRCVRLLSLCVNAIILDTASSFVSREYVCSAFHVYCPFVVYTCLQSTSPFAPPTSLRFTVATSPYESLRIAHRLSVTSFELPHYTTVTVRFTWPNGTYCSQRCFARMFFCVLRPEHKVSEDCCSCRSK